MKRRFLCLFCMLLMCCNGFAKTDKPTQTYLTELAELERASRRVVFLIDQSNHAQDLLFGKENWADVFGGKQGQGKAETWLRDVLGMVDADWQSVHSNVFFYGMADRQDTWQKGFLRHVYWHRGDPFLGLNKRKEKYRSNRYALDYGDAALSLAMLELTSFKQSTFYSELLVVQLEVVSQRHLTLPEPELFGAVAHYRKALGHVADHYQVDVIAQKVLISAVSGNFQATVYQVRPRVSEGVRSLASTWTEPRWEPTPQAVVLDFKLEVERIRAPYQIRHMAMFSDDDMYKLNTVMLPEADRHQFSGQFSIANSQEAIALPQKLVVGAWLEYMPEGLSTGLVTYDFTTAPIQSLDLSKVDTSWTYLWRDLKEIHEVKAMYPGHSLSDIRTKFDGQRLGWMLGLVSFIAVLLWLARSMIHKIFPSVHVACAFDFAEHAWQGDGVLASRSIAEIKGVDPILLGHLLIEEDRGLAQGASCQYQMGVSPSQEGSGVGENVLSLGQQQGPFNQRARIDVWLHLDQVQQPEQLLPDQPELNLDCRLSGGIFKGARKLTALSQLVAVKVPLERVPFKLGMRAKLPAKRLPLRWSQVVKVKGVVGHFQVIDESGFRYRERPQLQWRVKMMGVQGEREVDVPSSHFELQFEDGAALCSERLSQEFERAKEVEIQVALNLECASFFDQDGFYQLEVCFVNGSREVQAALMFQVSTG